MNCETVTLPGGGKAIVCSSRRRQRCKCGSPATLLCDWKVGGRKSGTCDAPLCPRCTFQPRPDKDLCAVHSKTFQEWQTSKGMAE